MFANITSKHVPAFISLSDQVNDITFVIATDDVSSFYTQLQRNGEYVYSKNSPHEPLLRIKFYLKSGNRVVLYITNETYLKLVSIFNPECISHSLHINLDEIDSINKSLINKDDFDLAKNYKNVATALKDEDWIEKVLKDEDWIKKVDLISIEPESKTLKSSLKNEQSCISRIEVLKKVNK